MKKILILFIALILVAGIVSVAKSVTIDSGDFMENATRYSKDRHIVQSSDGTIVVFYRSWATASTDLRAKKSINNGANWYKLDGTSGYTVISGTESIYTQDYSICIDADDNIYVTYARYNKNTYFKKLTAVAGTWTTWTVGDQKTVDDTADSSYPTITYQESNGRVWVAYGYDEGSANASLRAKWAVSPFTTWTLTTVKTEGVYSYRLTPAIFIRDGNPYIVYNNSNSPYVLEYSVWGGSSWSGDIINDIHADSYFEFSVTLITNTVHVAWLDTGQEPTLRHTYSYNGTTNWTTEVVSTSEFGGDQADKGVSLTTDWDTDDVELWCFKSIYFEDPSSSFENWDIVFKKWNGSSWTGWTGIADSSEEERNPTTPFISRGHVPVAYVYDHTDPYDVKFDFSIILDETSPGTINNLGGTCPTGDVILTWSTPGDDGGSGTLPEMSGYRLDYSSVTKTWDKDDYEVWIPTNGVAPPTGVSYTVASLQDDTTWYFRIWTRDEVPNWSGDSNLATVWIPPPSQTYTWTGLGGLGDWDDTDNWSGGPTYPNAASDKAIIDTGSESINTGAARTLGELELGSSYSGTLTLGGNLTLNDSGEWNGSLTISNANTILSLIGYNLTIPGTFSNNGTLKLQGGQTLNFTNDTNSGTVEYVGDGDAAGDIYTLLDSGTTDYYNLTINSTDGATDTFRPDTTNLTVAYDFTLSSGTFTTNDGTTDRNLTVGGSVDIIGTFTANNSTITCSYNWNSSSGTFNFGTSTIDLTGTGDLTTAFAYLSNLKCAAAGKTTTLQSTTLLLGTLTLGSGGTLTGPSYSIVMVKDSGTPLINGGATVTLNAIDYNVNNGTITVAGGTYGVNYLTLNAGSSNVTYNLGGDMTITGTGNFSLYAVNGATNVVCNTQNYDLTADRLWIGNSSAYGSTKLNLGTSTIDIGASGLDMDNNGGSHTLNLSSATVTCEGNWELVDGTGNITQNPGTSTVTLDDTSGTQIVTSNNQSFYHLVIDNTGTSVQLQDAADIDGGLNVSTGTLALNSFDITISSDVSISGSGSLTCSSGEQITVGGNWSAASGATFTASSSTVTFNASSGTKNILSSGTTFYNLVITTATTTATYELSDELYVQNNFTLLNGTFDTNDSGNYVVNVGSSVYINGGTFEAGASTITCGANWDSSGGTFNYGTSTVDLTGTGNLKTAGAAYLYNLTCATTTKTTTLQSDIYILDTLTIGDGTLTDGDGSSYGVVLFKNSGTPLINGGATVTLNFINYAVTNGTITVAGGNYGVNYLFLKGGSSNVTYNLGGNITVNGLFYPLANNGMTNVVCNTQNNDITAGGLVFGADTANGSTTLNCGTSTIDIGTGGLLAANAGGSHTLNLSNATVTCEGNWQLLTGTGTITQNWGTSTVAFDNATSTSTLTGSTTFYVLVSTTTGKNVKFTSDIVIGVTNHLNFENITLRSTSGGATWYLNLSGTQDVSGVDVQDSNASGSTDTIIAFTSTDSGNNTEWDFGPPEAITDLTGECDSGTGDVTLYWSTPGDDYNWQNTLVDGSKYRIDYSSYSIAWSTENYKVDIPTHSVAPHTQVSRTITGLTADTTWYFRIWTQDEVPLWSGLSNGATVWIGVVVDTTAPAAITDLTGECDSGSGNVKLSWSTPGDDEWIGTLVSGSKYRIDYSTYSIAWSTNTYDVDISTSGVAPYTEVSHTITGLTSNTTYYFRIWTADEVSNWSGLSNGATVWTYRIAVWDGGGVGNNWSTGANWTGDIVPRVTDDVVFNNTSNKPCTIDISTTVASFSIQTGSTITITASGNLTVTGDISLSTGTFNAGSTLLTIGGSWSVTAGDATFNCETSTVTFNSNDTGKTITSGGSSLASVVFDSGDGTGGWTLQDSFTCSSLQIPDWGYLIDNGQTVTVNGNIDIADFMDGGCLTSTGLWIQGANGNISNPDSSCKFATLQINNSVISTRTGDVCTKKIVLETDALLQGSGELYIFPSVNDFIDMGSGSNITTGSIVVELRNTPLTQKAFSTSVSVQIGYADSSTTQMTGDWTTGSLKVLAAYLSDTEAKAMVLDTNGYDLTVNGNLTLGYEALYEGFYGKIKFSTGTHTITDNVGVANNPDTYGYFDLGSADISIGGNVDFSSATVTAGTSTVTLNGSSGTQTVTSWSQSFYHLTINNTGTSVQLEDVLDVDGDLTISIGTLDTKSGENNPINIAGNWTFEGGTFECNSSTVTFDNASSTSTLTGSTTFYGLVSTASGKNVKVSSDTVIDVTGHLNFENITLRSTLDNATWYLNLSGTQDVSGVDVRDSNASGSTDTIIAFTSTDSGNNTKWDFGPPEAITDLTGQCDSQTGDVTLYWSTPGDDYDWQNTLVDDSKYRIDYSSYSIAWSTENYKVDIPTHSVAPHTEVSHTITGLTADTTWYFRIWTADEIPLWSGLSNGATVWVNPILSVSISTDTYNFGTIDCGTSTVSGNTITVTNDSNVTETYSIKCSSTTKWTPEDTPGQNEFTLQSAFHSSEPADSDLVWETDDILTESLQTCTTAVFSIDGTEHGKEVPPFNANTRKLWYRLKTPLSTSTTDQQNIIITISAEQSP